MPNPKLTDLAGRVFGKWNVIGPHEIRSRHTYWFCKCSCGTEKWIDGSSLKQGISSSCKPCSREAVAIKNRRPYPDRQKSLPNNPDKETQVCISCREEKAFSEYGMYKVGNYGRTAYRKSCKACRTKGTQKRYAENPHVRARRKVQDRESRLSKVYGITEEDFKKMLEKQRGKCKICNEVPKHRLNIDHCHKTGKVRGLLCWNCNVGIGKFKDNSNLLIQAVKYLEGR